MAKQEANYQYFWLKVVSAKQVEAQGKAALDNPAAEVFSSLVPDHQYIVPQPNRTMFLVGGKMMEAQFTVRLEIDPKEAQKRGLTVRYFPMVKPMNRDEALAWIKDTSRTGGAEWAKDGLCVLCSVAVEPVA